MQACLNLHAPLKVKRVKRHSQLKWLTHDIRADMNQRDKLRRLGYHLEYKLARNVITKKMFQVIISCHLLPHVYLQVLNFQYPPINVNEVEKELLQLNLKKATGVDNISPALLRMTAKVISKPLCEIFNQSIINGEFPDIWKEAMVVPILKAGSNDNVNNYRPVPILCTACKILERHVHKHVYQFLSEHNLISVSQSGFRRCHSCQTCLTKMINDCQKYIDNSEICGSLALDLSHAFDMINHDIFCSAIVYLWINNKTYLDNRTQRIKLGSHMSQREKIKYGVPQGSILGPLLFVLYINDLPCIVNHCDIDMYADDTSLKSHGLSILDVSEKLQNDCRLNEIWLRNNRMVVNTSKSKSMAICSYKKRASLESDIIQLNFEGTELEQVDECKILGLLIDENLSWKHTLT